MISFKEAILLLEDLLSPSGTEEIPIQGSLGRVLAEDVISPTDFPEEAVANKDGVAMSHRDTLVQDPVRIVGRVTAGQRTTTRINAGEGIEVSTGAKMPPRCDCVVPVEYLQSRADGCVVPLMPCPKWGNVTKRGEVLRGGQLLHGRGKVVDPAVLASMVTLGIASIKVFKLPRVGILNTGSELPPGKVASHGLYLAARAAQEGWEVAWVSTCPDEMGKLCSHLDRAGEVQLVLTTGGTGKGHADLIHQAMERMGAREVFRGVRMRPGKGTAFYLLSENPVICLPGGAGAMRASFEVLVTRAMRRIQGLEDEGPGDAAVECLLASPVKRDPQYTLFPEARVWNDRGRLFCEPLEKGPPGCGIIQWLSSGRIEVDPGEGVMDRGSVVRVMGYPRLQFKAAVYKDPIWKGGGDLA